jgi:hypothetical protein
MWTAKNMVPIVKMRHIDWKYYEDLNNTVFHSVIEKCKEVGLYDLMGFRYNWNKEILANSIALITTILMTTPSHGQPKGISAP